ncbi:RNA polymerase sigma factor SigF [Synechococcus sp. MIT S9509]|uniref:sigma-70 family RNA polymerase sigma factor n=1 Tax=unclassified Synechococcus TaxID=2626047 RepID=UPI0007BB2314|nr:MULTISPECIES: sigma-70 family RNA polymerase sigma factor [unclassified Synechococcus]KZR87733.1 RNA polymerase sigma factor SigF [Synechococcus sp. MIT S9504]KZR93239.1 RNA polymerase sigma factor SigF [Synechococcus sp. MIT S9509]
MTTSTQPAAIQRRLERQRRHERRRPIPAHILQRNDAVLMHLGLAHLGANRLLHNGSGERDDLIQEGRYGLIRALEHFDAGRGHRISSYAMPRITGQIRHYRRDRLQTLRIPWRLGDLHARGMKVQEQRLHVGLPELSDEDLAQQLGVTTDRWRKACMAHRDRRVQSLHGQCSNSNGSSEQEAGIECLQDHGRQKADPQHEWLIQMLNCMEPNHCRWLSAFWIDRLSLSEIARRECIDKQILRTTLHGILKTLRVEARRNFS